MFALAALALLVQGVSQQTETPSAPAAKISELATKCSLADPCRGVWKGLHFNIVGPHTATFKAAEVSDTKWEFSCKRDAFDDRETCTLLGTRSGPGLFMVWTGHSQTPAIAVFHPASEAYPETSQLVRVDRNEAMSVNEDSFFRAGTADRLIAQMKSGREMKVRYYDWPYKYPHDGTLDLSGFTKIYAAVTEMRQAKR